MNSYIRNNSFNFKKGPANPRSFIFEKRQSSILSKQQKIRSPSLWIQHSKQKCDNKSSYSQINKSADIAYFVQRERERDKDVQSTQNASYTYIGQIQALQRRKIGRIFFHKPIKQDRSVQSDSCGQIISHKNHEFSKLDCIKVNQSLRTSEFVQKTNSMQVQVQQLHYNMVIIQQRSKNKY